MLAESYSQIVYLTKDFDFIQEFLITDLMIKVKNTLKSHIWTVRVLSTSLIFFRFRFVQDVFIVYKL